MAALVALGVAYACGAATTTPFTVAADVVTAVPLAAMALAVLLRWPLHAEHTVAGDGAHRYLAWLLLVAAVVAWELVNYAFPGSRGAHPTLSSIADAVDRHAVSKALVFFGWLSLCTYVVHAGSRRAAP